MSPPKVEARSCPACRAVAVETLLDLGPQPVCSRYLRDPLEVEFLHPLVLGQCGRCGLVQLVDPAPAGRLRPSESNIAAIEPEGHLDRLAEILAALPGLGRDSLVVGTSFKDRSLLRRLELRGFHRTWCIDPARDLGVTGPEPGVETVQGLLTPEAASRIAASRGRAQLVLARHILEHAHDLPAFLGALRNLADPQGYVAVELPDCARALDSRDYTMLWEEHTFYFTPATFLRCLGAGGLAVERFETFPYPLEDSLVAIARTGAAGCGPDPAGPDDPAGELRRGAAFAAAFPAERSRYAEQLARLRRRGERVAVFGAGHSGATFVNLLGLGEHVDFFVDDHPRKKGLFMPGSRLPIRGSEALLEQGARLCLLALSPESEERVVRKNAEFLGRGGRFRSIFPSRGTALRATAC